MATVDANGLQAFADLQTAGLPPGAAAGVVGNLIAESSVNPGAVGDHGTSFGIAQWHNGRAAALRTFAAAKGLDPRALNTQLLYLVGEMKASGIWAKLTQTTDPNAAAALVMLEYERPASKDPTGRQSLARQVLQAATGSTAAAPGTVPSPAAGAGGTTTVQNAGLDATGGVRTIVIEAAFVVLALGLVALGVSRTFQDQIKSAAGAAMKVIP